MSKKRSSKGRVGPAPSRLRSRKLIALVAGAVAMAVLAVALVLSNTGGPGGEVIATVNGRAIAADDVVTIQARYRTVYGEEIDDTRALQRLIIEELVYQDALPDYSVDSDQAEQELAAQLEGDGLTLEWLKSELETAGIVYEEFLETFGRELAIGNYLDDAVAVTDEEAMERYERYVEEYGEMPPFEDVKLQIIIEMEEENLLNLMGELRAKAEIITYTDSG